jgi:hypothetical protein
MLTLGLSYYEEGGTELFAHGRLLGVDHMGRCGTEPLLPVMGPCGSPLEAETPRRGEDDGRGGTESF